MRLTALNVSSLIIYALLCQPTAAAQRLVIPNQQLAASSDSVRVEAFNGLLNQAVRLQVASTKAAGTSIKPTVALAAAARQDPSLRNALVELLNHENARLALSPNVMSSESSLGGYYADIAVTVARMGDPGVYRSLLPAIDNGDVVTTGIAAAGAQAAPEVLAILADPSVKTRRYGAAITLGKIAKNAAGLGVSAATLQSIRNGLLIAMHDSSDHVARIAAIGALSSFDDPELRTEMARVAEEDDATSLRGSTRVYPVRLAAQRWLDSRVKR